MARAMVNVRSSALERIAEAINGRVGKNNLSHYLTVIETVHGVSDEERAFAAGVITQAFQKEPEEYYRADLPYSHLIIEAMRLHRAGK